MPVVPSRTNLCEGQGILPAWLSEQDLYSWMNSFQFYAFSMKRAASKRSYRAKTEGIVALMSLFLE